MILENIDGKQSEDASKLEKALIERTEQLRIHGDQLKMDVQNTRDIIGIVPISGGVAISDRITNNTDKLSRFEIELNILKLHSAEIIDTAEFRRLLSLLNSPDEENLVVAVEVINNKMKEL